MPQHTYGGERTIWESLLALHLISEAGSLVFSVLLTPGYLACKLHGLHSPSLSHVLLGLQT